MQQFDPNFAPFIEGAVTSVAVQETPPYGFPNRVVDPTEDFTIHVEWEVFGHFTPLWINALNDPWTVTVYAESIGAGPEAPIGTATVAKADFTPTAQPNGRKYVADVTVTAGTLLEGNPGSQESGNYKLTTTVFLDSTLGEPGFDMIGFYEGPYLQVESPV